MRLPTLIVLAALLSAALLAYGTDPFWGQYRHGLGFILLSRRLQWPAAAFSLVLCVALLGLVIAGKQRPWWLLGLGPVVVLFAHRFAADPMRRFAVVENPPMVSTAGGPSSAKSGGAGPASAGPAPGLPGDDETVVGLTFNGLSFAFPCSALYACPVVLQQAHEKRFLLMWSPYAHRATAAAVSREIKPRELDVVSMPADALLLYNARLGQFINGLTGAGVDGQKPAGFLAPIDVQKRTWLEWRLTHPNTQVMAPPPGAAPAAGAAPLAPRYPAPKRPATGPAPPASVQRVAFIPTTQPLALPPDACAGGPAHVDYARTHLLALRDKTTGLLRAYDRQVIDPETKDVLFPTFRPHADPKRSAVAFIDNDSNSLWSADLKAIDGPWKGRELRPIHEIDPDVYWNVMRAWYPSLAFVTPQPITAAAPTPPPATAPARTPRVRKPARPPA